MDAGAPLTPARSVDATPSRRRERRRPTPASVADASGSVDADAGGSDAGGRDARRSAAARRRLDCQASGGSSPGGLAVCGVLALLALGRRRPRPGRRRAARWPLALAGRWSPPCLAAAPAAHAAFGFRRAITIDRTRIGTTGAPTTLTNYPLLISMTNTSLRTIANGGNVQHAMRLRHHLHWRRHHHLRRPLDLHVQLRDRELRRATTGEVIAWVNIPALKHRVHDVEHRHLRPVRRRHDLGPDAEPERHLGHELQGRLAPQPGPGGASPQMTDSTSTAAHATATTARPRRPPPASAPA